jgi:nucleoside-triphosphatase THEP1
MVFILTGNRNEGKTRFAIATIAWLQKNGLKVAGFLSIGIEQDGKEKSFELFDVVTLNSLPLATPVIKTGYKKCGRYYFNGEAIERGEEIIRDALQSDASLVVMDEIGKCEFGGNVWHSILEHALTQNTTVLVVVARKNLIRFTEKYAPRDDRLIDIAETSVGSAAEMIRNSLLNG